VIEAAFRMVNVAGWGISQPFVRNTPEFWDRVLAINLMGPTDTPRYEAVPRKLRGAFVKAIPFRRPGEGADAILFFASAQSDYVTGQVLSVSGGLTMAG
jgi:NAD(P)-dependent dehydrogenase (short-subunit alcohol dehydrogenase family)